MLAQEIKNNVAGEKAKGTSDEDIATNLKKSELSEVDTTQTLGQSQGLSPTIDSNSSTSPVMENVGQTNGNNHKGGRAIISLVLGIIGLVGWIIPIVGLPIAIIGLVFGILSLHSQKRGVAIAGIILSSIALAATLANAAIGAYTGAIGTNPTVNRILNTDNPTKTSNKIDTTATTLARKSYTNKEFGFSFDIPSGWTTKEGAVEALPSLVVMFSEPVTAGMEFATNINITAETIDSTTTLDQIVAQIKQSNASSISGYKAANDKIGVTKNGGTGTIIGGTYSMQGNNIQVEQLVVIDKSTMYMITATSLEKDWGKYQPVIEEAITSFSI